MAAEFRVVDIWVGSFPSRAAFEGYLHETYGDHDHAPLSKFAADMGQTFYDHDFLEAAYHEEPSSDLGALLEGHSFARSYTPHVRWIALWITRAENASYAQATIACTSR